MVESETGWCGPVLALPAWCVDQRLILKYELQQGVVERTHNPRTSGG